MAQQLTGKWLMSQTCNSDPVCLHRYRHREALILALIDHMAAALSEGLQARDRASAVLSGGSSPLPVYRELAQRSLDWARIELTLSDERWVAADDASSNEGMVRRELLTHHASAATLVPLYEPGSAAPQHALAAVQARLAAVTRPFDLCLLGMGTDGHTASLFPDAVDLAQALQSEHLVAPAQVPRLAQPRMTLTPHALMQSRQIVLLLLGRDKLSVYEQAMAGTEVAEMPVRVVLQQTEVPVHVFWAP